MRLYLGVDVGTTHITALALDAASGNILTSQSVLNTAEITAPADRSRGRSEWDAARMVELAWEAMRRVAAALPDPRAICGIGVSGQMHGVCLLDVDLKPTPPFIGWQDRRGEERIPDADETYLERIQRLAGDLPRARLATGFMGVTLFWLHVGAIHELPLQGARAAFISDLVVSWLTGEPPCTDPSNADGSGLFDATARQWNGPLLARLGIAEELLPTVRLAPSTAGGLRAELATQLGVRSGIPVGVSIGDNQASFLGSVADYVNSVSLNIGTGGQLSVHIPAYLADPLLETRCYPDGGYLLVSAGLCGGRSYAILRDFFRAVGQAFFGARPVGAIQPMGTIGELPLQSTRGDEDLYERMNELAAGVPSGSDGVICEPLFAGARHDPGRRALWRGLSATNFTPAHLARSLLEGLVRTFAESYERMRQIGVTERRILVGAGNGIRRNPLLARIAAQGFGMSLYTPVHEEEAAFGAAMLAAVGAGHFPDLGSAGRLIRYKSADQADEAD